MTTASQNDRATYLVNKMQRIYTKNYAVYELVYTDETMAGFGATTTTKQPHTHTRAHTQFAKTKRTTY